jgi:uncharacterized protein YjaG (DUF416 family)
MLDFSAPRLLANLADLSRWQVMVFVATCVEVLTPSYVRFAELEGVGDPGLVNDTVDTVWVGLGGAGPIERDLPSSDQILSLLPAEDDWNEWAPQAENAIAALTFLVRLVGNGEVGLAVRAAQQSYEAADEFASRQMDSGLLDAVGRMGLLESPTVQTELRRQEDLLRMLREAPDGGLSVMSEARQAARSQAIGGR